MSVVSSYGPLLGQQIRQVVWPKPSQKTYAEAFLRRQFDAGYLDRIPLADTSGPARAVYLLGPAGRRWQAERLGVSASTFSPRPAKQRSYKPLFLRHHLATAQVAINLRLAAESLGGVLANYASDRELRRQHSDDPEKFPLLPDALVVLSVRERTQSFLLELDRTTLTSRAWRDRVDDYWTFQRTDAFQSNLGSPAVLIVVDAPRPQATRRVRALKELIEAASLGRDPTLFWLATLAEAAPEAILTKPIWHVAGRSDRRALLPEGGSET